MSWGFILIKQESHPIPLAKNIFLENFTEHLFFYLWPFFCLFFVGLILYQRFYRKQLLLLSLCFLNYLFFVFPTYILSIKWSTLLIPYGLLFYAGYIVLSKTPRLENLKFKELTFWFFVLSSGFNIFTSINEYNFRTNTIISQWASEIINLSSEQRPLLISSHERYNILEYFTHNNPDAKKSLRYVTLTEIKKQSPPFIVLSDFPGSEAFQITYLPIGRIIEKGNGLDFKEENQRILFRPAWDTFFNKRTIEGQIISELCIFNAKKGSYYAEKGDTEKATQEFISSLETNPYCFPALTNLCFLGKQEYCLLKSTYVNKQIINYYR
ncbi:MAG: hypothetical protein KDD50_01995 [Bdellovibrionales bacterium]|nr:hypothetical protein [Bdellovibrionales bacterium]